MPEGQNPGSINSFIAKHPDLPEEEALGLWENELSAYRSTLATTLGITIEELHGHNYAQQLIRQPSSSIDESEAA